MKHEILIVDDDRLLRREKAEFLRREGYDVREARDGELALAAIAEKCPDLVLLDVDMPKLGGFATCQEIRRRDPLLPVIFLTAFASEVDQVRGFGNGGDDYLSKAEPNPVLLASVRRALARSEAIQASSLMPRRRKLGRVEVDFDALTAKGDGIDERLTKSEADFLRLLTSVPGRVFGYGEIFEALRGKGYLGDEHALQVGVNRLRKKIGRAGELIRNDRGIGYSLVR